MKRISIVSGAMLWLVAASPALAQPGQDVPPPPSFGVEVDFIEVDAVVTDAFGRFVKDLKPGEFEIYENGVKQSVGSFSLVDIPIRLRASAEPPEALPGVQSNHLARSGRLYVILLDDLHTSSRGTARLKNVARQFVRERLDDADQASVVFTSGTLGTGQEFTANRGLLRNAIERFHGRKLRPEALEQLDVLDPEEIGEDPRLDPRDAERAFAAQTTYRVMRAVARRLGRIGGRRKSILYFSEGIEYDYFNQVRQPRAARVLDALTDTLASATRANATIYPIDPSGLGGSLENVASVGSQTIGEYGPESTLSELRYQGDVERSSLATLADGTGGFATYNVNQFDGALRQIVERNSLYYMLGYTPTNRARDGKFRKIEVRVARPHLRVSARSGYTARSEKEEPEKLEIFKGTPPGMEKLIDSPLPVSHLPMRVVATPIPGKGKEVRIAVLIEADIEGFSFREEQGRIRDELKLAIWVLDQAGKVADRLGRTANIAVPAGAKRMMLDHGFRTMAVVQLEPGRYQMRVAAQESGVGLSGSVFYDLVVAKKEDPFRSVLLTTSREQGVPVMVSEQDRDRLPSLPTTRREFSVADELLLWVDLGQQAGTAVSASVIDATEVTVFRSEETSRSEAGGYDFELKIPLSAIGPGEYVLELRSALRRERPHLHRLAFRVTS